MKDVTITSFGLVIAYLLPGLLGLYGLSFWSAALRTTFGTFMTVESNVGLFLIVVLASLMVGMFANGIRWVVCEVWCARWCQMEAAVYANLSGERKLGAYRAAIDEWYRYHQWWGGAAVVAPLCYVGWIISPDASRLSPVHKAVLSSAFMALEGLAVFAAWRTWCLTVGRLGLIMKGGDDNGRSTDAESESESESTAD